MFGCVQDNMLIGNDEDEGRGEEKSAIWIGF